MSDIFREIDEELRRDNLLKLWSRYGRYVIAVAVLALVIAGAIVAWRDDASWSLRTSCASCPRPISIEPLVSSSALPRSGPSSIEIHIAITP